MQSNPAQTTFVRLGFTLSHRQRECRICCGRKMLPATAGRAWSRFVSPSSIVRDAAIAVVLNTVVAIVFIGDGLVLEGND